MHVRPCVKRQHTLSRRVRASKVFPLHQEPNFQAYMKVQTTASSSGGCLSFTSSVNKDIQINGPKAMPHEDAYTGKRHNSPVRLWVMINCIMGGFFALAGLVQFRDPAPIMWMVIYFVPSFLCFSIVYSPDVTDKLWWKIVFLIHFMCISIKQVFLGTQLIFWMKDRVINPLRYAEGREFFGIIIVQVWLLVCKCGGNIKGGSTSRTTAVTWCILFLGFFPFTFWFLLCVSQFNHCSDMW